MDKGLIISMIKKNFGCESNFKIKIDLKQNSKVYLIVNEITHESSKKIPNFYLNLLTKKLKKQIPITAEYLFYLCEIFTNENRINFTVYYILDNQKLKKSFEL